MTHTPGPWINSSGYVTATDGSEIADVEWAGSDDEGKANARLIASAPELLAALRLGMEWSEDDGYPDDDCMVSAGERAFRRAARAAIAKAEGRVSDA